MTAIRLGVQTLSFSLCSLGLVTAVTAGLASAKLSKPCTRVPGSPSLAEPPPADEPAVEPKALARPCDADGISTVIVRGQFSAKQSLSDHFAIQLPGKAGSYAAMTDSRGFFEMRIPREDFTDDLCNLEQWHSFSDDQMTLNYFVEFE